jgi:hypothetical protein
LLTGCFDTSIEDLKIPTSNTKGAAHQEFEKMIAEELTPNQISLLRTYQLKHPDSGIAVLEAIKIQEEANQQTKNKRQMQLNALSKKYLDFTAERIDTYQKKTQALDLKDSLTTAEMNTLLSGDINLSNVRLSDYKINKIQNLGPDNPKVYRYRVKYTYEVTNKNNFDIRFVETEFSLNDAQAEIKESGKRNQGTYSRNKKIIHGAVNFNIQTATKISEEEFAKIVPTYRFNTFKDQHNHPFKQVDFNNYKEKLHFRLDNLTELRASLEKENQNLSSVKSAWAKYDTLSPKLEANQQEAFEQYLLKSSEI